MVEEIEVQDGEAVKVAEPEAPKALFSIEILRLIRDAQKQHGLRHGDYQRYRGECMRIVAAIEGAAQTPLTLRCICN